MILMVLILMLVIDVLHVSQLLNNGGPTNDELSTPGPKKKAVTDTSAGFRRCLGSYLLRSFPCC